MIGKTVCLAWRWMGRAPSLCSLPPQAGFATPMGQEMGCKWVGTTSDPQDVEQALQAGEVTRIPGVQRQPVRMGDGGNQQISDPAAMRSTGSDRRGDDETVAPGRVAVERQGLEGALGLLKTDLTTSPLRLVVGQMRARRQLSQRDGRDGGIVRQSRDHGWIVPVDDDRGVEQSGTHVRRP